MFLGGGWSASRISVFEARLVYIVRERHSDSTLPPQNKIIIIKFSFDYEVNYAPPPKKGFLLLRLVVWTQSS